MMLPPSLGRVLLALGLIGSVCANAGCEEAPAPEKKGSTTSKYLAPDPTLCAASSDQTQADVGVAQWCLYRGKGGVYLTGYTDKGHAVKGLGTEFSRDKDGTVHALRLRVNDGSKFAVFHTLGTKQIMKSSALAPQSQQLVNAATRDLGLLHVAIRRQAQITRQHRCASNMLGTMLSSFVGAGTGQGAALRLLSQMGRFANASGSTCAPFIGSGVNGVSGLPFGGDVRRIRPQAVCEADPDPMGCMAEFGMFSNAGGDGGFSFDPNADVPGRPDAPIFPGADPDVTNGVFRALPGEPGGFDPTTDGASGGDDGCGGCTAFSQDDPEGNSGPAPDLPEPRQDPEGGDGCGGCTVFSQDDPEGNSNPGPELPEPRQDPEGSDGDGCGGCTAFRQDDPEGNSNPGPELPEPRQDPEGGAPTFSPMDQSPDDGETRFGSDFDGHGVDGDLGNTG
jgi:hypothetical protein